MSRLKVGDRVRRISNGEQRQVSDIDMSDGTFYSSAENLWYFQHDFELVSPPHPAESPDDWVTQDVVRARPEIDQRAYQYDTDPEAGLQWDMAGQMKWDPMPMHGERGNGLTVHLRCRRRDYPQKPAEVHTGGPYVARSEYERVCVERDALLEDVKELHREGAVAAADNRARKISEELTHVRRQLTSREESIDALNELCRNHEKRQTADQAENERLQKQINSQQDRIADLIDRQSEANRSNPNGWPLVPVDPSCIPEGHRAAEVTDQVNGKTTVIDFGRVHTWDTKSMYVQLVVEPIPTPAPLPRPEFPAWIRAGWWVAMDNDGDWYAYDHEPEMLAKIAQWKSSNPLSITTAQETPSMRAVPCDRWREAKWQVE